MSLDQFNICSKIDPKLKKFVKAFHVFYDYKGLNVLFITSDDKVYGFGQNTFGCCGLGHNNIVDKPEVIPELCNNNIKQFFIGYTFVLALNSDGKLFGWGKNSDGQLANGFLIDENQILKPKKIAFFADKCLTHLSCGAGHAIASTSEGLVYGWGCNHKGQTGVGKKERCIKIPDTLKLLSNKGIKSVHCVYHNSIALTTDGCVYSWGYNDWCQLGHDLGKYEVIYEPKLINNLPNIISIASGRVNTYFLTNDGLIYFCGSLGENNYQKLPKIIDINTRIDSLHYVIKYEHDRVFFDWI